MTSTERGPGLTTSVEELGRRECLGLLATQAVGRIGLLVDGKPEVLPVNFALDGDTVLFRTADGTALTQASLKVVAFEADHLDASNQAGWSVMIQGTARDIGDAIDPTSERLRRLTLVSWAPGARQRWFQVHPDKITGRRLRVIADGW